MPNTISADKSVGQLVAEQPHVASVLDSLQIDYCCGGDRSLRDACAAQSLDVDDVLRQLQEQAAASSEAADSTNWLEQSATSLCDHIEATHHAFLREQLPRMTELIAKVVAAHGEAHPSLRDVQTVFGELVNELQPHMMKEEQVLFPAIRQMEASTQIPHFPFGTVGNPIHCMEQEHEAAGGALASLRQLTSGYAAPADACNTYQVMLDGLQRLESDLHRHIHKENNILFPRAIEMERLRASTV